MAGYLRMVHTDPPTFMGALLECSRFIDKARADPLSTKADVLDSMETRMSLLVGKLASQPTCASFAIHVPPTS
jgi:hypothetical protein